MSDNRPNLAQLRERWRNSFALTAPEVGWVLDELERVTRERDALRTEQNYRTECCDDAVRIAAERDTLRAAAQAWLPDTFIERVYQDAAREVIGDSVVMLSAFEAVAIRQKRRGGA